MRELQDRNIETIISMPDPSTAAQPKVFRNINKGPYLIRNLRPPGARGPPISLFYPVFGDVAKDLQDEQLNIPAGLYLSLLRRQALYILMKTSASWPYVLSWKIFWGFYSFL
jgi:hypothetical protein